MKREVIQDFLNLPGIAGVALMDGRSRPYFFGVDQALNFQQKEALAQGIQQVVDTTPEGFGSFEFQFTGHQVYIYKLQHGIILLVLTGDKLVQTDYHQAISQLQGELQKDAANAIATFRLMAGNITLTSQNQWAAKSGIPDSVSTSPAAVAPTAAPSTTTRNGTGRPVQPPVSPLPSPPVTPAPPVAAPPPALSAKEVVLALNQMSQVATHYLGNIVVANYWKSSRPSVEWLLQFQADRSAQFTFKPATTTDLSHLLSSEEEQWIRDWIAAFVSRCSKVIRDFQDILQQSDLDTRQKALLPPP
ncbi:hypothetical protein [Leptolyngbya sp. FACHB-16]|uniref:hypothetical protein n=1 Tax=unclassified Leptolyngbya TaxID=2650499 RepID=UPI001683A0AA|nr:hypothetical protein [Leptolyngbya sp. FACHB-16]MBD2154641.1 hypothetical protein [Leptolyngbya sp. FACHB-16]